jgi:hypothetical protein
VAANYNVAWWTIKVSRIVRIYYMTNCTELINKTPQKTGHCLNDTIAWKLARKIYITIDYLIYSNYTKSQVRLVKVRIPLISLQVK